MDESFHELETELKALRPQRPSAGLHARLSGELASMAAEPAAPARSRRYASATDLGSWKWLGWRTAVFASGAAVVAFVSVVNFRQPPPVIANREAVIVAAAPEPKRPAPGAEARPSRYQPVAATNVLYDLQDEGTVKVEGAPPFRRVRYRYLDTYTWKNPKGNASLKWSVPRDEIRVIPASLD